MLLNSPHFYSVQHAQRTTFSAFGAFIYKWKEGRSSVERGVLLKPLNKSQSIVPFSRLVPADSSFAPALYLAVKRVTLIKLSV